MTEPNTTTTIDHRPRNTLALAEDQAWWSERQIAGLRQIGVEGAGDGDLLVFFHVCQRTGLDPFARQIHMVSRNTRDGDQWVKRWTIQTGIDGYRLIADRADHRDGTLREYEDTMWADRDGQWSDVWTKNTAPAAAKVTVLRNGHRFPAVAMFHEFAQTKRNGDLTGMWERMPANQLAKCAEALALRKAYPQDLSGVYTDDEMAQADSVVVEQVTPVDTAAAIREQAGQVIPPDQTGPTVNPDAPDAEAVDPTAMFNPRGARARYMFSLFNRAGLGEKPDRLAYAVSVVARPIESTGDLTVMEAEQIIASLESDVAGMADGDHGGES